MDRLPLYQPDPVEPGPGPGTALLKINREGIKPTTRASLSAGQRSRQNIEHSGTVFHILKGFLQVLDISYEQILLYFIFLKSWPRVWGDFYIFKYFFCNEDSF